MIVELCIVLPLANPEAERVFSFLWDQLDKKRLRLKNSTLETLLQVRGDDNFSPEKYDDAINMFLTSHPDGTLRKRPRHVDGHNYPSKRKSTSSSSTMLSLQQINELLSRGVNVSDIDPNLVEISEDEWSDSDDSDLD